MAHGLSCSAARGIFLDQGLNPCLLLQQVYSLPLSHQGRPTSFPFWSEHLDVWEEDEMKTGCASNAIAQRTTASRCGEMGELWDARYWRRLKRTGLWSSDQRVKRRRWNWFWRFSLGSGIYLNACPMSRKLLSHRFLFKSKIDLDNGPRIETQWQRSALSTYVYCQVPWESS